MGFDLGTHIAYFDCPLLQLFLGQLIVRQFWIRMLFLKLYGIKMQLPIRILLQFDSFQEIKVLLEIRRYGPPLVVSVQEVLQ